MTVKFNWLTMALVSAGSVLGQVAPPTDAPVPAAPTSLRLREIPAETNLLEKLPQIPFVKEGDTAWQSAVPFCAEQVKDVAAQAWMAVTRDAFLFHIVVHKDTQTNPNHGHDIWKGDCLYISLDARGDNSSVEPAGSELGDDDAVYCFGLGDHGPEGFCCRHGQHQREKQDQTVLIRSLVRDDQKKTTTYDIAIPHIDLSTGRGQTPTLGLALGIAHKNQDHEDLNWGHGWDPAVGNNRDLHTLALPTEVGQFANIAPLRTRLYGKSLTQPAAVTVAVAAENGAHIRAHYGSEKAEWDIPAHAGLKHIIVEVSAERILHPSDQLEISVTSPDAGVNTRTQFSLVAPGTLHEHLQEHLTRLTQATTNTLARANLDAIRRLIDSEFEQYAREATAPPPVAVQPQINQLQIKMLINRRIPFRQNAQPQQPFEDFCRFVEQIDEHLPTPPFDWNKYIASGKPLILSCPDADNSSPHFFSLQLPVGYQPTQHYPLTIHLSRFGAAEPWQLMSNIEQMSDQNPSGFVLVPFVTPNADNDTTAAASATWKAIETVLKQFPILTN